MGMGADAPEADTGNFRLGKRCDMSGETMMFRYDKENENQAREILRTVYAALKEKGYNPISQIVGYIMSGDPTYITSHNGARGIIRKLERDELLEELVKYYLGGLTDVADPSEEA
jgi:uncharacterized protein (UPF0297 family)